MKKINGVGFSGKMGSGKTTAATLLADIIRSKNFKPIMMSFATPLKQGIFELLRRNVTKEEREFLQELSELVKRYFGELHFTKIMEHTLSDYIRYNYSGKNLIIIDDVRFLHELELLLKYRFKIIRIEADIEIRQQRIPIINPEHHSETALDEYPFSEIITNNGTLEELKDKIYKWAEQNLFVK